MLTMPDTWGIALIVRARDSGRILRIQELEGKPEIFKEAGMYSVPLETGEEGENVPQAAFRTGVEEVGISPEILGQIFIRPEPVVDFRHGIPIFLAWADVAHEQRGYPLCRKVRYAGWFTVEEMLDQHVRIEVPGLLEAYVAERSPVAVAAE